MKKQDKEIAVGDSRKKKIKKIIINLSDCQYPVLRHVAKKMLSWKIQFGSEEDWDIYWTDNAVQCQFLSKLQAHQKVNHFPGMFALARKNNLARNLQEMRDRFPAEYSFFPKTWLLPVQYNSLRIQYQSRQKGKAKTFIVKPEASCQGRGIFLTRSILADINHSSHYVVQRYLHKPLLIEGLKFDLRIYVLVAGCDPLRIYVYQQGLTRLATVPYEGPRSDNLDNLCMHLTNYAINKQNPDFVFNTSQQNMSIGHKRSLTSTYEWLKQSGKDLDKIRRQINHIIIRTLISGQPMLAHHYRSSQFQNLSNNMCFEILGFDVILDHNCKPYLLQVNHTPSFTTDTPLDRKIKENLIHDALKLMNINEANRNQVIKTQTKQTQERMYSGKRKRLTNQQRIQLKQMRQAQRDVYQNSNLGGFYKIFPCEDFDFSEEIEYANKNYQQKTSIKPKFRNQSMVRSAKPPRPTERKADAMRTTLSKMDNPLTNKKLANSKSLRKTIKSQVKKNEVSLISDEDHQLRRKEC